MILCIWVPYTTGELKAFSKNHVFGNFFLFKGPSSRLGGMLRLHACLSRDMTVSSDTFCHKDFLRAGINFVWQQSKSLTFSLVGRVCKLMSHFLATSNFFSSLRLTLQSSHGSSCNKAVLLLTQKVVGTMSQQHKERSVTSNCKNLSKY